MGPVIVRHNLKIWYEYFVMLKAVVYRSKKLIIMRGDKPERNEDVYDWGKLSCFQTVRITNVTIMLDTVTC